ARGTSRPSRSTTTSAKRAAPGAWPSSTRPPASTSSRPRARRRWARRAPTRRTWASRRRLPTSRPTRSSRSAARGGAGPRGGGEPLMELLNAQTLARLAGVKLRARAVMEGVLSGLHKSPHQGQSVEFAEHKEYAPGDELRHLDWKAFGKFDKYYVKRFEH